MKIAFFHELHFGGARRVVSEYAKILNKNHDVDIYYVDNVSERDVEKYFNKKFFYKFSFKKYEGSNWKLKFYKDFIEPFRLYFLHKQIARDIDSKKYDFVFVHPSQFTHAPWILRFLKTSNIYYCQEPLRTAYDPIVKNIEIKNPIKKFYEKANRALRKRIDYSNIKKSKLVISNCRYSQNNIKKAYGMNAPICHLGVDHALFHPKTLRKTYDILFVGEDVWMEGYDTLEDTLKLFKTKPRVHVVKKEKGKYISDEELVQEYNKSKIVAILGRYDPFSMVPLEAMACGVPPVVVREGGPMEAVENGKDGYIVKRNPNEIYQIVDKLLRDKKLRAKIGKAGRKKVIDYWNWEKSTERLMKIVDTNNLVHING